MKAVEAKIFIGDLEELLRDLDTAVSLYRIYSDDHVQFVEAVKRTHFGLVKNLVDWEGYFPFLNFTYTSSGLWANGIEIAAHRPPDLFQGLMRVMGELEIRDINIFSGLEESEVLLLIRLFSLDRHDVDFEGFLKLNNAKHLVLNQLSLAKQPTENEFAFLKYLKGEMSLEDKLTVRPGIRELVSHDPDTAARFIQAVLLWYASSREGHSPSEVRRWFKYVLGAMIEEVFGHVGWTQGASIIAALLRRLEPEFIQSALAGKENVETGWLDDRVLVNRFLESYREQQQIEALQHRRIKMVERLLHRLENPLQDHEDPEYRKEIREFLTEISAAESLNQELWIMIAEVAPHLCYAQEHDAGYQCLKTVLEQVLGRDVSTEHVRRFWISVSQCLEALRGSPVRDQLPFLLTEFLAALSAVPPEPTQAEKLTVALISSVTEWIGVLHSQEYLRVAWRWIDRLEGYIQNQAAAIPLLRLIGEISRYLVDAELYHEASSVQERLESLLGQPVSERIRAEIANAIEGAFKARKLVEMFERMVAERRRDRLEAIQELQELGDLAKRAAISRLRDPDWHVRRNSLIVVERSGTQADMPLLFAAAEDPIWQVRREAIRTITTILERIWEPNDRNLHRSIVDLIKGRLQDENFQVKSEVIKLIRNLNIPGVSSLMMQLFEESESVLIPREVPLQAELLSALASAANVHPEETKVIIRFLSDIIKRKEGFLARRKSQEAKEHALRALSEIEDERAKSELARLMSKLPNATLKKIAKDVLSGKEPPRSN